jgi:hypothetical protein
LPSTATSAAGHLRVCGQMRVSDWPIKAANSAWSHAGYANRLDDEPEAACGSDYLHRPAASANGPTLFVAGDWAIWQDDGSDADDAEGREDRPGGPAAAAAAAAAERVAGVAFANFMAPSPAPETAPAIEQARIEGGREEGMSEGARERRRGDWEQTERQSQTKRDREREGKEG